MSRIGIICSEGQEVFTEVARILEGEYSHETNLISPERELSREEIGNYDVIVPKISNGEVYSNLKKAEAEDVETVNSLETSMAADHNVASMYHLAELDYDVPERIHTNGQALVEKPAFEAQQLTPRKNPDELRGGCITEEYIDFTGTDYKIYLIDTMDEVFASGIKTGSKLEGETGQREQFNPIEIGFDEQDAESILSQFFDADFLGVDFIQNGKSYYAVDVNSAPSFRGVKNADRKLASAINNKLD